jgi:hypothetical protein
MKVFDMEPRPPGIKFGLGMPHTAGSEVRHVR